MSPSTTAPEASPLDGPRALTPGECRRWLQQHHEGRLGYQSGRGPRSVVVSYAIAGDEVLVRVPDYNDIAQYAPGTRVTLAVDGTVEPTVPGGPAIEEVSVAGVAEHAGQADQPEVESVRFDESWPTGIKTSVVSLPLTQLTGVQRRPGPPNLDEDRDN